MKKHKLALSMISFAIMLLFAGITYAYFYSNMIGSTETTVEITTADYGKLIVRYPMGTDIIYEDRVDLPESQKNTRKSSLVKFSVENTGSLDQPITIGLKDIENGMCQYASSVNTCTDNPANTYVGNELVYNLYSCGEGNFVDATINNVAELCTLISDADATTPTETTFVNLMNTSYIPVPAGRMGYYVFVLTMKNLNEEQNYNVNREFGATTYVELYNNMLLTWEGQLLDEEEQPIRRALLTLHSDPVTVETDDNGYFKFENVLPYEHTLTYEKDGETITSEISILPSIETRASNQTINYVKNEFGVNVLKLEN